VFLVEWVFLEKILGSMDFPSKWCSLILNKTKVSFSQNVLSSRVNELEIEMLMGVKAVGDHDR